MLELLLEEGPKLSTTSQRTLDHLEDQELLTFICLHIISGFWFNPYVFKTYSPNIMRGTETKYFTEIQYFILGWWCKVKGI